MQTEDSLLGRTIDARYEVLALLGTGGMGAVYKAKHVSLGTEVALKVLHRRLLSDADAVLRFKREAELACRLNNAHVVRTIAFGTIGDAQPYIVMELLHGQSLSERIGNKPLPIAQAFEIFGQCCLAFEHAHEMGILHRDIKPGNIMLVDGDEDGPSVKITDFGIAKVLPDSARSVQHLTQTGEVLGSPAYMSPEQCAGLPLDKGSDIYSFGCVMYEALTGSPPFEADGPFQLMMMHGQAVVERPSARRKEIASYKGLDAVILRALAKSSPERQSSFIELRDQLAAVRCGKGAPFEHEPATRKRSARVANTRLFMPLVALAVLVVSAFTVVYMVRAAQRSLRVAPTDKNAAARRAFAQLFDSDLKAKKYRIALGDFDGYIHASFQHDGAQAANNLLEDYQPEELNTLSGMLEQMHVASERVHEPGLVTDIWMDSAQIGVGLASRSHPAKDSLLHFRRLLAAHAQPMYEIERNYPFQKQSGRPLKMFLDHCNGASIFYQNASKICGAIGESEKEDSLMALRCRNLLQLGQGRSFILEENIASAGNAFEQNAMTEEQLVAAGDPGDPTGSMLNAGVCWLFDRDAQGAKRCFESVVKKGTARQVCRGYAGLSLLALLQGRPDEADHMIRNAMKQMPETKQADDLPFQIELGKAMVLAARGKRGEALHLYETVLPQATKVVPALAGNNGLTNLLLIAQAGRDFAELYPDSLSVQSLNKQMLEAVGDQQLQSHIEALCSIPMISQKKTTHK